MDDERIEEFLARRTYWYHKIRLSPDIVTPGFDLEPLWDQVRKVRSKISYEGKRVLDIASFDGMFTFEAEKLGASQVVSADCLYKSFENFLFCREVLQSKAIPYYNVSPYNLAERLDVFFDERYDEPAEDRRFDIVQHLGLLYHLRDPMLSLSQARSVLKPGGHLLIETDMVMDRPESFMLFNGVPDHARVRDNYSVWWAPTKACLLEILKATMFEVVEDTYSEFAFDVPARGDTGRIVGSDKAAADPTAGFKIGRAAVIAKAIAPDEANPKLVAELQRTYRNPGIESRLVF